MTEGMTGEEQCGFRSGRGCVDQVFVMKQMSEKFCGKNKSLFVVYMDLEKAYDRIDRDAMWRGFEYVWKKWRVVKSSTESV